MKYHELLRTNVGLGSNLDLNYRVAALSNTTINQCKEILEYTLRREGLGAVVEIGEYDNIVQDSERVAGYDCVIFFWEIANLVEDFPFIYHQFDQEQIEALNINVKEQIQFVFERVVRAKLVLFNRFSAAPFTHGSRKRTILDSLCDDLNRFVELNAPSCVHVVDIERIYFSKALAASIDYRYFLSSKALYSTDFYRAYAEYIKPLVLTSVGKIKKVIVFDCDYTLWSGILAEDGFSGIRMYKEIQHFAVDIAKKGVVVGLCSKNNPEDVDEALRSHPDMVLTDSFIVIKAVNWEDKAANLRQISSSLNIGLDSFVFVDDSDFEVNLIKEKLPEVAVFKVPKDYAEYVCGFRSLIDEYFFNPTETKEDVSKIEQYRTELVRAGEKGSFKCIDDYLKSLQLELKFAVNPKDAIDRLAQLSQKTNQFNLTTRRYTPSDIQNFMEDPSFTVLAMNVYDKYGSYGITGLAISRVSDGIAQIDTLLMSCRVLGRNIEFRFIDYLLRLLHNKAVTRVTAEYIKTAKNDQVADFYLKAGFLMLKDEGEYKYYEKSIPGFVETDLSYIKVNYA